MIIDDRGELREFLISILSSGKTGLGKLHNTTLAQYRCFPLHLLVIFVTGPSLHCLEGNSLECSIRLSATHHPLCPTYIHRCRMVYTVLFIQHWLSDLFSLTIFSLVPFTDLYILFSRSTFAIFVFSSLELVLPDSKN